MSSKYTDDVSLASQQKLVSELDELLSLAESLQEKVDVWNRRIFQSTAMLSVFFTMGGIFISWLMIEQSQFVSQQNMKVAVMILGVLVIFCVLLFMVSIQLSLSRRQRDERALEEVVSLLREIEYAYGKEGKWSTIDRAKFRIRLSRFTVGRRWGLFGVLQHEVASEKA